MLRALAGFYGRHLDDRWNPILVKEVRQSLRGRSFRVAFVCTLVAVTLASMSLIMDMDGEVSSMEGRAYFGGIFFCLLVAVMGLVPFQAFTAMGAEWDENTYDLLVISRLGPGQIVAGKFLAALCQTALYFSAFTPYLVFGFLLQRIDLLAVVYLLATALEASLLLTAVALCLSTLSRVRFARVILMASLAGLLAMTISPGVRFAAFVLGDPGFLRRPFSIGFMIIQATVGTFAMAYAFLAASNMLAHPEENRSTNVRILTTVAVLAGLGLFVWILTNPAFGGASRAVVASMGSALLLCLSAPAIFFTSEHDSFGIRVRRQVPRRAGLAFLAFSFLPGGGRGVALWLLHAALVTLFVLVAQASYTVGPHGFFDDGIGAYLALLAYCAVYLLLPSSLLAPFTHAPQLRAAVRLLVPFLVIVFAYAPAMIGFFLDDRVLMRAEHAGNAFHVVSTLWDQDPRELTSYLTFVGVLLAVGLLLTLPRLVNSVREVARARRDRLSRDARREPSAGVHDAVPEL